MRNPFVFLIRLHEPNSVVGVAPKACSVSSLVPSSHSAPARNVCGAEITGTRQHMRKSMRQPVKAEAITTAIELSLLAMRQCIMKPLVTGRPWKMAATWNSQSKTRHRHDKSITRAMAA